MNEINTLALSVPFTYSLSALISNIIIYSSTPKTRQYAMVLLPIISSEIIIYALSKSDGDIHNNDTNLKFANSLLGGMSSMAVVGTNRNTSFGKILTSFAKTRIIK